MSDTTPARAWRVVLEKIEADLLSGALGPGDRLPPERELCTMFGISRATLREALRVLEDRRLIERRPGRGTPAASPTSSFSRDSTVM